MWSEGSADERTNSQQQEPEGQPSALGDAASGGWADSKTARSVGDHRVEQNHDLASGTGRVVPCAVPFGRWAGGNKTSMTGSMACPPQRDYPPNTEAYRESLRQRIHPTGIYQRSASNQHTHRCRDLLHASTTPPSSFSKIRVRGSVADEGRPRTNQLTEPRSLQPALTIVTCVVEEGSAAAIDRRRSDPAHSIRLSPDTPYDRLAAVAATGKARQHSRSGRSQDSAPSSSTSAHPPPNKRPSPHCQVRHRQLQPIAPLLNPPSGGPK